MPEEVFHDGSSIRGEYGFRMELYAVDVVFAVAQRLDLSFWADRCHFETGRQTVVRHYPRVVTSHGELLGDALKNIVFFRMETRTLYAVEHIGQVDELCAKSLADGLMPETYAKYRLSSGISADDV